MKKNILHIIDDLGRGGAETMLVKVLQGLTEYRNIVVTLYPNNEFARELICDEHICLNLQSKFRIPFAARRLRTIIKQQKVDLVHSHLFWSTVVARLSVPKSIPLLTTVHAFVASSVEYRPAHMRWIERTTYQLRPSTIIAVAKGALDEYFQFMKLPPKNGHALYTFVDTEIFQRQQASTATTADVFRLVTVGNLKTQKDHAFLLKAFEQLKGQSISLDIYGKGNLQPMLQEIINEKQLSQVTLKGQQLDLHQRLPDYDLFVMSSLYEGFALGVLEAMAMGMPLLLTDIPSFQEQCEETACYFEQGNVADFITQLQQLRNNETLLHALGKAAKERVLNRYTFPHHLVQLRAIYQQALM